MRRKTVALLLALTMCLSFLSACGADSKPDGEPSTVGNTSSPTEQQPDEKEEQPAQQPEEAEEPTQKPEETEEPTQKPEESGEPASEPEQTQPTEESNAGTEFLALLQEEWESGVIEGERPGYNYYIYDNTGDFAWISNGVVHIYDGSQMYDYHETYSYDIAAKELSRHENSFALPDGNGYAFPMLVKNDIAYFYGGKKMYAFDMDGVLKKSFSPDGEADLFVDFLGLDEGFLFVDSSANSWCLYSYEFEKIAGFSSPQIEAAHGSKEYIRWNTGSIQAVGGIAYGSTRENNETVWYRLNMDSCEWEKCEKLWENSAKGKYFCGKYRDYNGVVYDSSTGEVVFEYGELYPVANGNGVSLHSLSYFGGDKYLGYKNGEYRWVNLTDLSMSDPLLFPEGTIEYITILNDTNCVYRDKYGWFLWNYNTGEEETILMFDN